MENFWDSNVWGTFNLLAVLLLALLFANAVKRVSKTLRASLIPTSVLGGALLLVIASFYRLATGQVFFDTAFFGGNGRANLEILTYHTLALGFIATSWKSGRAIASKERSVEIFNTGLTTVATYLLQGIAGLAITLLAARVTKSFFAGAGILLPFGYGQGTGQALNYGGIFEHDFGFAGGKSFGLTIAALGFLCASIGGVIHLQVLRRKGRITGMAETALQRSEEIEGADEIPMQESIDKFTIQVAFVAVSYLLAFFLMRGLGNLLPGMRSVIFGFNFLLGVLSATLLKTIVQLLRDKGVMKKEHINRFLMTRIGNFFFDLMVVAGIAAIRLQVLKNYWVIIFALGIVGMAITFVYNAFIAVRLFPAYCDEQFLTMYGMLTGTASTGIVLLREIDPAFETPAADNMVYQNFPAIIFGLPLMLLGTLAGSRPGLVLLILIAFFLLMNVLLFRGQLLARFRKA